jgi:NAD(P)-dependent dehydrogenase (short-subunit alcohol dehydrogenase family)
MSWRVAWVTGASSGIGREIALLLARRGIAVGASSRSSDKLAVLAAENKLIAPFPLDVTDRESVTAAAAQIWERLGPVDLVVLDAGVGLPMGGRDFDAGKAEASMAVNYLGVINGIDALLPRMRERREGHIAIVASVAGYRGLPRSAAYGPSKAALINLAESLRPDIGRDNIDISVINPGFVETPMTSDNKAPMPFMITAEEAATRIVRGLERRKFEIAFPWPIVALTKTLRVLPYPLYFWYIRTFVASQRRS